METQPQDEFVKLANELYVAGYSKGYIEAALIKKGISKELLETILNQIEVARNKKRRTRGTTTVLIGVALLGIGFILTVFLFYSNSPIANAMYGLTALGMIVLVIGLIDIFG